jgi:hypothetical protein
MWDETSRSPARGAIVQSAVRCVDVARVQRHGNAKRWLWGAKEGA